MEAFTDKNYEIQFFTDQVLVVCPRCAAKALVKQTQSERRLSCSRCGLTKAADVNGDILYGAPVDPYFRLVLFLNIDCCGETLFAYNQAHLRYLKDFVVSELRQRANSPDRSIKNRSLVSRLPRWLKSAKNRVEILKKIELLEARLLAAE